MEPQGSLKMILPVKSAGGERKFNNMTQNWVDIGFAALKIDASGNRFELAEPFAQIRQFDPAGDGRGAALLMAAQSINLSAL
jgi:hypothetical protein